MKPKGHHEIRARDRDVEGSSDRSFGLVIAGALVILGGLKWWHAGRAWPIYLACAAVLAAVALLQPAWLAPLNRIWTKIGSVLAKIVNPIVMGAVFFCVITPTAMLMRLRSRDILNLRANRAVTSYWIVRDPSVAGSMTDQF